MNYIYVPPLDERSVEHEQVLGLELLFQPIEEYAFKMC